MSHPAIKVQNLSKQYRIGEREGYKTIREAIANITKKPFHKFLKSNPQSTRLPSPNSDPKHVEGSSSKAPLGNPKSDMIWALNDVSFVVQPGEVIGIIGRNGAGKSTLLKILSKITEPSEGKIELRGRVGSLLEVGTGFHPELTGHENAYLYGAILGMDRWDVTRKFDEIVSFAELEKFIDTPVKRYSSGMYMRLAFSVAAHLETEILLVDEVLAVGDLSFQKKCMGKMEDVSHQGRTVLFVSHNMGSVRNLCHSAVWLESGKINGQGNVNEVVADYENHDVSEVGSVWLNTNSEEKEEIAHIQKIEICDRNSVGRTDFLSSAGINIKFTLIVNESNSNFKLGFDLIKNGDVVFRSQQVDSPHKIGDLDAGRHQLICEIPPDLLNSGEYLIIPQFSIHLIKGLIKDPKPVLKFRVKLDSSRSKFHFVLNDRNHPGAVFPMLNWELG
jgi:lipopolysaccharide transport system ATP-binding protein